MSSQVYRSIEEDFRHGLSWKQKWRGPDRGLITCWEVGRKLAETDPELAEKAKRGELPVLGWKGGVEKKLKKQEKTGTLFYLAQWQGLRGEDLNINLASEPIITCTRTEMRVTFTGDVEKYGNA